MSWQSAIIATGSIAYPPEWSHAGPDRIRQLGVSKVMTLTSTYDHRVIQGAESGAFLRRIEQLLQGETLLRDAGRRAGGRPAPIVSAHPASASAPPLGAAAPVAGTGEVDEELLQAVQAATSLLKGYRTHGHLAARLDPLGSHPKSDPAIQPENLNRTPELMSRIPASILRIGVPGETLLEALPRMREAYCGTMAYQFEHLSSHQQRIWLREMIETGAHRRPLEDDEKRRLLSSLIDVFEFERFLEKAYLGQKMFSIEGLDVVVPMLDELVTLAHRSGAEEVVFGMAHRGRLSVLAHNLGRPVEAILAEFEGSKRIDAVKAVAAIPHGGTGDVKYHYGHQGVYETSEGEKISIRLYPNPSHLEFVNPVVTGGARFLQSDLDGPTLSHDPKRAVPVLLHGDAAFPAQGVVAETLNLGAAEGLQHRRHRPPDPEQPGRLHHRPRGGPLDPLRGGHGEGIQRPDRARQRRRRRGLLGGDPPGDGLPRALEPRHRHRRDRLSPLRPQRDRRARLHPATAGGQDQGPQACLRDLCREAARRRDSGGRGCREGFHRAPRGKYVRRAQAPAREDGGRRVRGPDQNHRRHRRARPQRQPARRHRGPGREAPRPGRGTAEDPGELHRPPQAAPPPLEPDRGDGAGGDRLRPGRGARLRLAADRGRPHPPHRPGHRARHLLAPPPRPPRREHGPQVLPDAESRGRRRPLRALQQPALGDRLPRLRVRLLGRDAERPGPLGGPVRRLRQRRPGDRRQLHRLRRGQSGGRPAA